MKRESRLQSASSRSSNPRASVIISTYNRPCYLRRVLEGYLQQSRLPAEIVVAEDGSGDETAGLLEDLRQHAAIPMLHIWQEDTGFRKARILNRAIAHSFGDYLILCDDDCIPIPTLVEDHLNCAEEGCFLQGHRVLLAPAISETFAFQDTQFFRAVSLGLRNQAQNVLNALRLPLVFARKSRSLRGIRGCNMSLFRKDFLAVNGFNEEFEGWGKEDSELVVRLYKYGLKRKDLRFQGSCYHLYHVSYSRENLERNLYLLERTQKETAYRCRKGIDQYLGGSPRRNLDAR